MNVHCSAIRSANNTTRSLMTNLKLSMPAVATQGGLQACRDAQAFCMLCLWMFSVLTHNGAESRGACG